jgi:hypothetical protein
MYQNGLFDITMDISELSTCFWETTIMNPKNHPDTQQGFGEFSNNPELWLCVG